MEAIIEGLAQYGPLGLWTASLLWMNWQQRKDAEADEQRAAEALRYHQDKIAEKLTDQEILLEKALDREVRRGQNASHEKPINKTKNLCTFLDICWGACYLIYMFTTTGGEHVR